MANAVITIARLAGYVLTALSAILSLYAAVDAAAVYTDVNVFVSGMVMIVIAVAVGPLFCFFAVYGLVFDLGLPAWEAVALVAPALLAWGTVAGRTLLGVLAR